MFNRNIAIALVVVILVAGLGYFAFTKINIGGNLSADKAAQKAVEYINNNLPAEIGQAELVSSKEENGVYKFVIKVQGQEYDSYVTKDGKVLFQQGIDITTAAEAEQTGTTEEVIAQAKPDVKLFVMSYCPYGLQAEKMYLPVYNLLKDKADMGIYFVDYIMHDKQEIDENLTQYCIQKEENSKYYAYLSCFVKAGDSAGCLTTAKIDKTKLSVCVKDTDKQFNISTSYADKTTWLNGTYPKFDIYADLNTQYGVQGSPTIVINGKTINVSPRSPEAFKQAVCKAFTTQPEECNQTLSTDAAAPSFGTGTTTSTTNASCE